MTVACLAGLLCLVPGPVAGSAAYFESAAGPSSASQPAPAIVATLHASSVPGALSIGNGWAGIDYHGTGSCSSCLPPDVSLASGNGYVVELTNSILRAWTTAGTLVLNGSLNTIVDVEATDHLVQPQVVYDSFDQRWFVSVLDTTSGEIYYGGSLTSDPAVTGTAYWNFQHFDVPTRGQTFSQPRLSVDGDEAVISVNLWTGPTTPVGFEVLAANITQLTSGETPGTCNTGLVGGSADASYVPAVVASPTNTTFLVSDNAGNTSWLNLRMLTGTPTTCTLSAAKPLVTNTTLTPDAAQPGTTDLIATSANITSATWRGGTLWVAATNGCTPTGDTAVRSCLHLWKIYTTNDSIAEQFYWSRGAGYYDFYPAVATDPAGDLIVVYGESSAVNSEYPSLYVATQAVTDPVDTLEGPHLLLDGSGPNIPTPACSGTPLTCPFGLWFGATFDPLSTSNFWVAGEYTASDSTSDYWHTWINEVTATSGSAWLAGTVTPESAQVLVDGSAMVLSAGEFNETVTAGTHTLQASLVGFETFSTNVTLDAGQGVHLTIALVPGASSVSSGQGFSYPVPLWVVLLLLVVFVAILAAVLTLRRKKPAPPRNWHEAAAGAGGAGTAGLASAIASALDKRTASGRDDRDRRRGRGGTPYPEEPED